ncbi:DUF6734 family protein [Flavobacteriaceae bacterium M23B6Z8]
MKIIQSFWGGQNKSVTNNQGWIDARYNWLSWILSANQLIKHHEQVELYTDTFGYEILITKLQLPYSKVHVVLDELDRYPSDLWALSKIKTYSLQEEPFLHVDGDVFVWQSLGKLFSASNLCAQNLELATSYYHQMWQGIKPSLKYISSYLKDFTHTVPQYACNMGIIGGTNIDFFKEFCKESFEFVDKNLIENSIPESLNFNIFFEQVLFYNMLEKKKLSIDYLIPELSKDNEYIGFGDFASVPHLKQYLHLLGFYKRNKHVCQQLENYVIRYYPESYARMIHLFQEKVFPDDLKDFTAQKIEDSLQRFRAILKNADKEFANYSLLDRNLYAVDIVRYFDKMISENSDFKIVFLKKHLKEICESENKKTIVIKEILDGENEYEKDEIDEIIFHLIDKPIGFKSLLQKMQELVDAADPDEAKTKMSYLLTNRIRNYLILKIVTIF